jgi:3-oxoacyl-[acyl-carrier protein] reductase
MRKVALVTGASRGLGREIALMLGMEGYFLFVNYLNDEAGAADVADRARSGALAVRADVSDAGEVAGMSGLIKEKSGRLDLLVNNAGVTGDSLLPRLSEEKWRRVIDTNLRGCFNAMRALAPLMAGSGGGHMVNISSRSGVVGRAGQAAYSASKAALLGLTLTAARELGGQNIRVNAVIPGYMPTSMGTHAPEAMKRAMEESLLGRLSSPAEVASFVCWLAGTEGITGQAFSLDSRAGWA